MLESVERENCGMGVVGEQLRFNKWDVVAAPCVSVKLKRGICALLAPSLNKGYKNAKLVRFNNYLTPFYNR